MRSSSEPSRRLEAFFGATSKRATRRSEQARPTPGPSSPPGPETSGSNRRLVSPVTYATRALRQAGDDGRRHDGGARGRVERAERETTASWASTSPRSRSCRPHGDQSRSCRTLGGATAGNTTEPHQGPGGALRPGPVQVEGRTIGKNARDRPRIITGGQGSARGYRLAPVRDEFNIVVLAESAAEKQDRSARGLSTTVGPEGRSPARDGRCGSSARRAEVARRADALLEAFGEQAASGLEWLNARRNRWILGTPDQARSMVQRFADAGIERIMLQDFVPLDLQMIDLLAEELIGKV